MSGSLKHLLVADKGSVNHRKVLPGNWNAEHVLSGGIHGQVLRRDTGASTGWSWMTPPPDGWQWPGTTIDVTRAPYLAVGDGVTDDTDAIQAAFDDACALPIGAAVYFPAGVYLIHPQGVGLRSLTVSAGITIAGAGAAVTTIKMEDSAGPYRSMLESDAVLTDVTGLTVTGLCFDHNIANNPIANTAEIDANPQFSVAAFAGTDITYGGLWIKNASSVNNLVANGVTVRRVVIADCHVFDCGTDPNDILHDASVIYTHADDVVIARNRIESSGVDDGGATTAIETHGSRTLVVDNVIRHWRSGMNITGIHESDTVDVSIVNNLIQGGCHGIRLWSVEYLTHTSGYGFDGVLIADNVIHLDTVEDWPTQNAIGYTSGIALIPDNDDLPSRRIVIENNLIHGPADGVSAVHYNASLGLGWYSANDSELSQSRISGNTIINFPMAGIRLSCQVTDVEITDNTLIDCGRTLDGTYTGFSAFRTPIFIGAETIAGLLIQGNTLIDRLAEPTDRPEYFLYLLQTGGTTCSDFTIRDNTYRSAGTAMTKAINQDQAGGTLKPLLDEVMPDFVNTLVPFNAWALGSKVLDPVSGQIWTISPADQLTWVNGRVMMNDAEIKVETAAGPLLTGLRMTTLDRLTVGPTASNVPVQITRIVHSGTALQTSDVVLGAGWGDTAGLVVGGSDQAPIFIVTSNGVGQAVNATIQLTYKNGVWLGAAPTGIATMIGGNGTQSVVAVACNATTFTISYPLLPVATFTYQFAGILIGH